MLCLIIGALLLASIGCATSNYTPFVGAVVATQHPLVAQYSITHFNSGFSAWVEFGTDTNYGRQTSVVNDTVSIAGGVMMNIFVAGMLPQKTYHMRAHVDSPTGPWVDQDHTFTTGALPAGTPGASSPPPFPAITVTQPTSGLTPAPGVELLALTSPTAQAVVVDLQGNVIWYCPGTAEPVKPMDNGHFIIVGPTDLQEVDLTCKVLRDVSLDQVNQSLQSQGYSFTVPPPLGLIGGNPFHHDVVVLPNGHWIALCQIAKTFTDLAGYPGTTNVVGDALIDIDPNGNVVWAWSSFEHLDVHRYPYFGLPDWTHSNAIVYTADGNLLLSMRHQSWILKIDYANGTGSGNVLWTLGKDGDFTLLAGDSSQWFYAQHYPYILSVDGSKTTLAVYDDGNFRIGSDGVTCGPPPAPPCYTRATIFEVDESNYLATLAWQYLPGFFSFWGGSINSLSNGDIEFDNSAPSNFAGSSILEVTQTDSPQVVWEMDIAGGAGVGAYRGYRIPSLYPGVTWQK